ncbi:MAG: signal peptidase I [Nanobdellota archaeon]
MPKEKRGRKARRIAREVWDFIWNDDSPASWIVNIVLAYLLIKFIVYPGLGMLLSTDFPVVAVVSGSMYHGFADAGHYGEMCGEFYPPDMEETYDTWWDNCGSFYEAKNITKEEFRDFPMHNGFSKGDIIVIKGSPPDEVEVGDIIVFRGNKSYPIIHRVVDTENRSGKFLYQTKGDHNERSDPEFEKGITYDKIIGEAYFRIPYLGYLKIWAAELWFSIVG